MYIFTYLYILPEISAYHLQLKCMGGHFFFPGHPYIESTTVLSDTCICIMLHHLIRYIYEHLHVYDSIM